MPDSHVFRSPLPRLSENNIFRSAPGFWDSLNSVSLALYPLSLLFRGVASVRRRLLKPQTVGVPVIVVGNISVGGTGKTPLIIVLAQMLTKAGYRPGIISRGYGGNKTGFPALVSRQSTAKEVGDEACLMARRLDCPIAVCRDRVAAAKFLVGQGGVDVLLSDDGLQHYRLARSIEIAVIDGEHRFGNGFCLPAGPLREPVSRLGEVDFIIANGKARPKEIQMQLRGKTLVSLTDQTHSKPLAELAGSQVHALAGIGNPHRFFDFLRCAGIQTIDHAFPDHHEFSPHDIDFGDDLTVVMTEKDAVKLQTDDMRYWYIPVDAELPERFAPRFLSLVEEWVHGQ